MPAVIVGLVSALVYGSADFLGGLAARRISAIQVTAISAVVGVIVLLVLLPFVGGEWSSDALLWGALAGASGAVAVALLYACLAIGPMSILSPLTAVMSAIVPMTWGLVQGERLQPVGYLALAIALVAVVLVGFVPERGAVRPTLRGLAMAVGSGFFIGLFLILIDRTPDDSGLTPLIASRVVNALLTGAAIVVVALLARRRSRRAALEAAPRHPSGHWRTAVLLAIGCGVLDIVANAGMLLGLRLGELTIVSVLIAMYPAGTIILAAVVLRERIARAQAVGLVLALVAAGLLALA